ncbi:MAG: Fic family protein [Bacillota bacterium]|nr:Fic family protein [Bacillota bacterium]
MPRWDIVFDPKIDTRHPDTVKLSVEIEAFRRSVLKIPVQPALRRELDRMNIVRQIKGTTGLEGNPISEERIDKLMMEGPNKYGAEGRVLSPEEREVVNVQRALSFISRHVRDNPGSLVSQPLIRRLHEINTEQCDYPDNIPGEYRHHDSVVGEYATPDHRAVPGLMERFEAFINSREVVEGYQTPIRAVLAHFYLVSIHPFGDGNGRTARALEAYLLYQGKYNVRGFYSLANHYYRHRREYMDALQNARFESSGDLNQFVRFALAGFVSELEAIQEEILKYVKKVLFRDLYLEFLTEDTINRRMAAVLEVLALLLPSGQGIPVEQYKNRSHPISAGLYEGKSDRTLLRDLKTLQSLQLVHISDGKLRANDQLLDQLSSGDFSLDSADMASEAPLGAREPPT